MPKPTVLCNMKSRFLSLMIFAAMAALYSSAQSKSTGLLEAEDFDCPTGVRLVENECNQCYCTSEGELACTIHECPENRDKGLENCTLRTSWRKGCNKCWCITIGTVCTEKECKN